MWILNPGEHGVVKDQHGAMLPANAWTDANNVSFGDQHVHKSGGMGAFLTANVPPYGIFAHKTPVESVFAYMGLEKVYGFTSPLNHSEITRLSGLYTGAPENYWQGTSLNDFAILNNGIDVPQAWGSPPSPGTRLIDLPNWPATTRTTIIKAYKNYLVACDVTKAGVRYPRMVKWSHPAAPGTLPDSWDESDANKDAGEIVLSEGDERIVDAILGGDVLVIYTENSTSVMRFIGGFGLFSFGEIYNTTGILAQQCAYSLGRSHFLVSMDDIVLHSLAGDPESIVSSRLRRWFYSDLNSSAYACTRVVCNAGEREIWVLYPSGNSTILNRAIVWNFRFNTWSVIDIPNAYAATEVVSLTTTHTIWDGDAATWDSDTTQWNSLPVQARSGRVMMVSPYSSKVIMTDETDEVVGQPFESFMERIALPYLPDKVGQPTLALENRKYVTAVWPVIQAPSGTKFRVEVGSHESLGDDVNWSASKDFVVGQDVKVDLYAEGRFLAVRFTDYSEGHWHFITYALDVEPVGKL